MRCFASRRNSHALRTTRHGVRFDSASHDGGAGSSASSAGANGKRSARSEVEDQARRDEAKLELVFCQRKFSILRGKRKAVEAARGLGSGGSVLDSARTSEADGQQPAASGRLSPTTDGAGHTTIDGDTGDDRSGRNVYGGSKPRTSRLTALSVGPPTPTPLNGPAAAAAASPAASVRSGGSSAAGGMASGRALHVVRHRRAISDSRRLQAQTAAAPQP